MAHLSGVTQGESLWQEVGIVPSGTGSNSRCPHGAAAQERSPSWSRAASISVSAAAINLLPQHAERIPAAPGSPGTREARGSAICSSLCWDEQSWPWAHLVHVQPTFCTSTVVSSPWLLQPGRRGQQTASPAHPAPNASHQTLLQPFVLQGLSTESSAPFHILLQRVGGGGKWQQLNPGQP